MFKFLKKLFGGGSSKPTAEDIRQYKKDGATFLDVRTPGEYKSGHIKGAPNIPLQSLPQNIARVKKMKGPIIIYCRSGGRAGRAMSMLKQQGIECFNAGGLSEVQSILRG